MMKIMKPFPKRQMISQQFKANQTQKVFCQALVQLQGRIQDHQT